MNQLEFPVRQLIPPGPRPASAVLIKSPAGGLPRGRTTLLVGGPGSGKTIFALQCLVHGARDHKEPGIFVAFEEVETRLKQVRLDAEEAVLEVRAKSLQTELLAKQVEKTLLAQTKSSRESELKRGRLRMRELRGADLAKVKPK